VFSQDEIREALGYGTIVDETQVLVPTNYMPLADMRGGDLDVETVPSGRNVPNRRPVNDMEDEEEDYNDIEDDDEDENFD
jgi:hypothetical protein